MIRTEGLDTRNCKQDSKETKGTEKVTQSNEIRGFYIDILKPTLSFLIALTTLLPATIIVLIAGICIKLDSKGPMFYSQTRLGKNGKVFNVYKLRTMIDNAEVETGAVWTEENDPRITKVGNVIRKNRIDELPQLLNVLRGDMAIVGPRPERPELTEQFEMEFPGFKKRLQVKPGITGLAQVSGGYNLRACEKSIIDGYYIDSLDLVQDISIILKTVKVVVSGAGAR